MIKGINETNNNEQSTQKLMWFSNSVLATFIGRGELNGFIRFRREYRLYNNAEAKVNNKAYIVPY